MRDGVNINSAVKIKRLVLPDELKNLEPNHCFVKLCGNYPITKLRVKLQAPGQVLTFFYKLFSRSGKNNSELVNTEVEPAVGVTTDNSVPVVSAVEPQETRILKESPSPVLSKKKQFLNTVNESD